MGATQTSHRTLVAFQRCRERTPSSRDGRVHLDHHVRHPHRPRVARDERYQSGGRRREDGQIETRRGSRHEDHGRRNPPRVVAARSHTTCAPSTTNADTTTSPLPLPVKYFSRPAARREQAASWRVARGGTAWGEGRGTVESSVGRTDARHHLGVHKGGEDVTRRLRRRMDFSSLRC